MGSFFCSNINKRPARNQINAKAMHSRKFPGSVFLFFSSVILAVALTSAYDSTGRTFDPPEEIKIDNKGDGPLLELLFTRGSEHNHPLMAIWIEDIDSNFVETIYVAESIGTGYFRYGTPSEGRWMPGPVRRPAALPYWGHKRGVRADDGYYIPDRDNPVPDAITGPTPKSSFVIYFRAPSGGLRQFRLLFEINQSWDWNDHWTNNKFPGDPHYMSSSQPALVYEVNVDLDSGIGEYELQAIGHSHWSGQNGNLYPDLSTITTALDISSSIKLRIP